MRPARESSRRCRFRADRRLVGRDGRGGAAARSAWNASSDRRDCGLRRAPSSRTNFPSQTHRSSPCRSASRRLRAFAQPRLPCTARSNVPGSCCRRSCAFLPDTYCLLLQSARRPAAAVRRGGGVRRRAPHALERDRRSTVKYAPTRAVDRVDVRQRRFGYLSRADIRSSGPLVRFRAPLFSMNSTATAFYSASMRGTRKNPPCRCGAWAKTRSRSRQGPQKSLRMTLRDSTT